MALVTAPLTARAASSRAAEPFRVGPSIAFRSLSRSARIAVAAVAVAGGACIVSGAVRVTPAQAPLMLALVVLSILTATVRVALPLTVGTLPLSLSYVVNFLAILFVGPWLAAPIAAASAWSQCTFRVKERCPWYQTVFSVGALALTVTLSGLVYRVGLDLLPALYWARLAAAGSTATVYFLLNAGLLGSVVALSSREALRRIWKQSFLWSAPSYFVGAALAMAAAEVSQNGRQWWTLVFALPVYLTYRSYRAYAERVAEEQRQVKELSEVQLATIEALALAIEAKDSTSHDQLQRMQVYSEGLARALGMTEPEIRGVRTAALLHDVGNLAVPEHILSKPGRLTYEEYERLKIHARVGAEIIRPVPFPYPVAPLVLSHHERWDGRGYPSGQKGHDIPLGARILAVVDCFTSMLTDRPYRPPRTYAEAIATLRENGGAALDPTLVERFIEVLPSLESQLHGARLESQSVATADRPTVSAEVPTTALADIAVAHREEQMLRDIAHSLSSSLRVSDTLALISSRLVTMMPLDACALFLVDPSSELFLCSHVVGTHQAAIRAITASTPDRLAETLPTVPPGPYGTGAAPGRLQSVMVCSLETESGTIGALAVYHADRGAYTADHRRLLSRVAAHAAKVIANAVVFEQTQEQSLTDMLTGLPNRRYLDRQLAQEFARVQRNGGQVSVLVLDMDAFKQINDEFGHQAGDRALKEVSHTLRSSLRAYDLCARFAGDEFVVVLGDCDTPQAERRRLELQQSVASLCVEPAPGRIVSLSVSIGAATFPGDADTADGLIAVADRRMYRDKASRKLLAADQGTVTPDYLWQ